MFQMERVKKKTDCRYKSLYLKNNLIRRIEDIAVQNNTSFNRVVTSMIEYCLEQEETESADERSSG